MMLYLIDERTRSAGVPQPRGLDFLAQRPTTDFRELWRRNIQTLPGHNDAQIVFATETDDVRALLQQAIALVGTPRSIWMLRVLAHAAPAYIGLGTGVRMAQATLFSVLAQYMTSRDGGGRGVEIHGCQVSGSRRGGDLLQAIADAVGMPVRASPQVQRPDTEFRFEGTFTTFEPRARRRAGR
jgi:hypothetical protein